MAEKANMCLEDSLAVWTGDDSHMCCQESLAFDFLACLRCSAAAVLFASQVAAPLYREERHSVFPCVGDDGKRFHGDLQIVFVSFALLVSAYLLVAHRRRVFSTLVFI